MGSDFTKTMLQMQECYREVVLPAVKKLLKSHWQIISVETEKPEIAKWLDVYGGCDWLLLDKEKSIIYGVASRIQFAEKSFDTFTVRFKRDNNAPTEYEKRKEAIKSAGIYPKYTFQAYVSKEMQVLGMAMMFTSDLLKFIEKKSSVIKHTGEEQIGQASFIACKWEDIYKAGYPISIYHFKNNSSGR